ncbi:hypothetical protein NLM33_23210 [Bradyrhizobium sp. CCGUVB1N3]|uniref:hypothetical protein n=1 Tax=Bradyrhizobium sp. CCGUVB1N3 TaxID=2949629 RepID=UPI0020B1D194|nr:hypothetical protein [Bradyrhizobium sp. CCGUVB1N3]MCP3473225.1 hypothetical protein [Bradyrhizobium sp. CCGUVB1N3]
MNKLVTLPIVDAALIVPTDDKAVRLAREVQDTEKRVRLSGVARNLLERDGLSESAYAALCELNVLAGKLTKSRPTTVAGLLAKANAAQLLDGYGEGFSAEIQKELARDVLRLLAPGSAAHISAELSIRHGSRRTSAIAEAVSEYRLAVRAEARARQALEQTGGGASGVGGRTPGGRRRHPGLQTDLRSLPCRLAYVFWYSA